MNETISNAAPATTHRGSAARARFSAWAKACIGPPPTTTAVIAAARTATAGAARRTVARRSNSGSVMSAVAAEGAGSVCTVCVKPLVSRARVA